MAGRQVTSGGRSRTILWCVPRSGSTALTKCLSFIDGVEVWFEPYSYCRLVSAFARDKVNFQLPTIYGGNEDKFRQVADIIEPVWQCKTKPEYFSIASIKSFLERSSAQHIFVKDIGFTIDMTEYGFLPDGYTHTFLIRHPLRVFSSFRKAIFDTLSGLGVLSSETVDEETFDIGHPYPSTVPAGLMFRDLHNVWKHVSRNSGSAPIVIDGDDLLTNPAEILPKYCRAVGLPYTESLLKWDASTDVVNDWKLPADKELTKSLYHLYERAMTSSEFFPPSPMPDRSHVTPDVIRCVDHNMEYYKDMYSARIKI